MKKKLLSLALALTLAVSVFTPATSAYASATQQDMVTSQEVQFGTPYSVTWNDQKCWCKLTVPQKGIVGFDIVNPYAELVIDMTLYDANGECIAAYKTDYDAVSSARYFGIDAGTYYFEFETEYGFGDGDTSTYSFSFTPNENCESEPNKSKVTATPMKVGVEETGYLGGEQQELDATSYNDDEDFYRISLKKGNVYNFYFSEERHTTIVKLLGKNSNENETWPSTDADRFCVAPGDTFVAPYTGDYYIHVYNYAFEQYQYTTKVTNVKLDKTSIKSLKSGKSSMNVKWKKVKCNGYQLQYSTRKNFKGAKTLSFAKNSTSASIKKLSSKKKYYVRIRTCFSVKDGKKAYSGWSKSKCIKVK